MHRGSLLRLQTGADRHRVTQIERYSYTLGLITYWKLRTEYD